MCLCDPVAQVSICSSSAELYFSSSIILSLFPIEHCSKEYLDFYPTHSTRSPTLGHSSKPLSRAPRPTCPLETVCVSLLDLVVTLTKFLLLFIFSLETTVRAFFLSRQPSLRAFPRCLFIMLYCEESGLAWESGIFMRL